jgi:hypothetical protein
VHTKNELRARIEKHSTHSGKTMSSYDEGRRQAQAAQDIERARECQRRQETANRKCQGAGQSDLSGSMAGFDMYNQGRACTAAQNAANEACKKR